MTRIRVTRAPGADRQTRIPVTRAPTNGASEESGESDCFKGLTKVYTAAVIDSDIDSDEPQHAALRLGEAAGRPARATPSQVRDAAIP